MAEKSEFEDSLPGWAASGMPGEAAWEVALGGTGLVDAFRDVRGGGDGAAPFSSCSWMRAINVDLFPLLWSSSGREKGLVETYVESPRTLASLRSSRTVSFSQVRERRTVETKERRGTASAESMAHVRQCSAETVDCLVSAINISLSIVHHNHPLSMLLSPAYVPPSLRVSPSISLHRSTSASLPSQSFWNKFKNKKSDKDSEYREKHSHMALARQRLLTLAYGDMETVRVVSV